MLEKSFRITYLLSYFFLLICLLSAYFLQAQTLLMFASIYLPMMTLPLAFSSKLPSEKKPFMGIAFGASSLLAIGVVSSLLGQYQIMGVHMPSEWATSPPALSPSLLNPSLLLSLMMVLPNSVAEESLFRITFYHTAVDIMGDWVIPTQAVLFGLFHYYAYHMSIIGMATATAAGICLGLVYKATGSEFAITASHALYNSACIFFNAVAGGAM